MMPNKKRSAKAEFTSLSHLDCADVAPQKLSRSDDEFQSDMLNGVSRTFALTIPQLPSTLCKVVSNAYLLCRIVDTIEDEPVISAASKRYFCHKFVGVLDGAKNAARFSRQLSAALSSETPAAEHELIRNVPRVVDISRSFSTAQREAVRQCVATMANGMGEFQLIHETNRLKSVQDLDRYCYYVAGVVGEMLTSLFCLYSPAIAKQHDRLIRLAVSFGQGLQMTNILKDVWEDYRTGFCWLPRQIFAEEGFDLRELSAPRDRSGFQRGVRRLIGVAHRHLQNALTYTLLIPREEVGIRNFCLWALGLAMLTLGKINRHLGYTNGSQVKIARRSVKATVIITKLAVHHDAFLKLLFRIAAIGLPLATDVTVWSASENEDLHEDRA